MSILPGTADIHFVPETGKLYVDKLVDLNGNPLTDIHKETAFKVTGRVELPGLMSGKGVVTLAADEIGGPLDREIGRAEFPIPGSAAPSDPPSMTYPWTITVPATTFTEVSKKYYMTLVFAFKTAVGGHTDVAGSYDLETVLVV